MLVRWAVIQDRLTETEKEGAKKNDNLNIFSTWNFMCCELWVVEERNFPNFQNCTSFSHLYIDEIDEISSFSSIKVVTQKNTLSNVWSIKMLRIQYNNFQLYYSHPTWLTPFVVFLTRVKVSFINSSHINIIDVACEANIFDSISHFYGFLLTL